MTHEAIKEKALLASYAEHLVLFASKHQYCSLSR